MAEVGALKYEILHARNDPQAKVARDLLLKASPGSEHRVLAVERGEGTLARGRKELGAEKALLRPPPHWPYRP